MKEAVSSLSFLYTLFCSQGTCRTNSEPFFCISLPAMPQQMRCIITGPEGTPYEGGCFVFDLFFPSGYPNVAPLMSLQTTGEGRMRFNPNLYADGKVGGGRQGWGRREARGACASTPTCTLTAR